MVEAGLLDCTGEGPGERGETENHQDPEGEGSDVRAAGKKATILVRIWENGRSSHSPDWVWGSRDEI